MNTNLRLEKESFRALCIRLDTPVSLGAYLRLKYSEYESLVSMEISPGDYKDAISFRSDYLAVEYLSKFSGFPKLADTKKVAISAFKTAEKTCQSTNQRLSRGRGRIPLPVSPVLFLAARKISTLLGDLNYDWLDLCKWGPGVTQSLSGSVTIDNKLREKQLSITESALPFARATIGCDLHWLRSRGINALGPVSLLRSEFQIVNGARFTTVPKNAKTDRGIAIEPTLNQFLQGGIGIYIRSRLRRVGVNLKDQGINQRAAAVALEKSLATVDLSAASDSISGSLVLELLPLPWYHLLDQLRSKSISVDGEWVSMEKFSAMGNGFTFELESLIFWAIAQSCIELTSSRNIRAIVYGDDIILPSESLPLLQETFDWVGFSINRKKTHHNSLFRESCGVHYFDGIDVTPIYLREPLVSLDRLIHGHNQAVRCALRWGYGIYYDSKLLGCAKHIRLASKGKTRGRSLAIPLLSESDSGFISCKTQVDAIHPHGTRLFTYSAVARKRELHLGVLLAYWYRFSTLNYIRIIIDNPNFRRHRFMESSNEATSQTIQGCYNPLYAETSDKRAIRGKPQYRFRKERFSIWENTKMLVSSDFSN